MTNTKLHIYTLASKDFECFITPFVESLEKSLKNSSYNLEQIGIIPFGEEHLNLPNSEKIKLVEPDPFWDNLGKALFENQQYRLGVEAWRYFRKLNIFNDDAEDTIKIFIDLSTVFTPKFVKVLDIVKQLLENHEIVLRAHSVRNRTLSPSLQNLLFPSIKTGFNASFFAFKKILIKRVANNIYNYSNYFKDFTSVAPEQFAISLMIYLNRLNYAILDEALKGTGLKPLFLDFSNYKKFSAEDFKKAPFIKLSGALIHKAFQTDDSVLKTLLGQYKFKDCFKENKDYISLLLRSASLYGLNINDTTEILGYTQNSVSTDDLIKFWKLGVLIQLKTFYSLIKEKGLKSSVIIVDNPLKDKVFKPLRFLSNVIPYKNLHLINTEADLIALVDFHSFKESHRKVLLQLIQKKLKYNGFLVLALRLHKGKNLLWNLYKGKPVEEADKHGTLSDIIGEVSKLGFQIENVNIYRRLPEEHTDLAILTAVNKDSLKMKQFLQKLTTLSLP